MPKTYSKTRGVSIHWLENGFLRELKSHFGKASHEKDVRQLENLQLDECGPIRKKGEHITSPDDQDYGAAYIDCLVGEDKVGEANIVLLHPYSKNSNVSSLIATVSDYCRSNKMDPKSTYVWIDFLCLNLHRIAAKMKKGKWNINDNFQENVIFLRDLCSKPHVKTLVSMTPYRNPEILEDVRILYELFLLGTSEENEAELSLCLPLEDRSALLMSVVENPDIFISLVNRICELEVEKIQENMIIDPIETIAFRNIISEGSGFKQVNAWIRDFICNYLFDELLGSYGTNILNESDVCAMCEQIAPLCMQKKVDLQALRLYMKVYDFQKDSDAVSDTKFASLMQSIALLKQNFDQLEDSLLFLKRALQIYEKKEGVYSCEVADIYKGIGDVHFALEAYDSALDMYKMTYSIEEKLHGTQSTRTADALNKLGKLYAATGNSDEAMANLQQALQIREGIHGSESEVVVESFQCIAQAFLCDGDVDQAISNYMNALAICESINHDKEVLASILNELALIFCDAGKYEDALPYFERAIEIYTQEFGRDHPHTKIAQNSYKEVKELI